TPGTDDGANPPGWRFAPNLTVGMRVLAGQFIAYMGDSGDAETTVPHLHFELHRPDGVTIDPYPSLQVASHSPAPVGRGVAARPAPASPCSTAGVASTRPATPTAEAAATGRAGTSPAPWC